MVGGKSLIRRIKDGNIPHIIFILGRAEFKKRQIISLLKQQLFTASGFDDIKYFYVTAGAVASETDKFADAVNYLKMPPMFGGVSLIIVNLEGKKIDSSDEKALYSLMESWEPGAYLIIWQNVEKLKARDSIYPLAANMKSKHKNLVAIADVTFATQQALSSFVYEYMKANTLTAAQDTVDYLIEISGKDINNLKQNLTNIFFLLSGEQTEITPQIVDSVIYKTAEQSIFQLSDELSRRNFTKALELVNNLVLYGAHPLQIYAYIKRFYKQMFTVMSGSEKHIAKINKFVAMRLRQAAGRYSEAEFNFIFRALLDTEVKLKSSNFDPLFLIERFILYIRKGGKKYGLQRIS